MEIGSEIDLSLLERLAQAVVNGNVEGLSSMMDPLTFANLIVYAQKNNLIQQGPTVKIRRGDGAIVDAPTGWVITPEFAELTGVSSTPLPPAEDFKPGVYFD